MSDTERGDTPAPAPERHLTIVPKSQIAVPAHALTPAVDDSTVTVSRKALFDLLRRVKQLAPCHRDPHRFHMRKDEIASILFGLATAP